MVENLKKLQDEILHLEPKDLEEKGYAKIDGAAVRNYIINLDMPEELADIATSSGILGGTLSINEKYIFLEKHEGKDVAAYAAVLEGFYFVDLGKNHERVLVASFKRMDAILPMFKEKIIVKNGKQQAQMPGEPDYIESPQSYLNLVDLNPATNAVNLINELVVLPYMKSEGEAKELVLKPYNLSSRYPSGLDDKIMLSDEEKAGIKEFNRGKNRSRGLVLGFVALGVVGLIFAYVKHSGLLFS